MVNVADILAEFTKFYGEVFNQHCQCWSEILMRGG